MTRLRKLKWSRNAFDGVVIDPDSVGGDPILFGKEFVEENTVCTSLINCNSPMVMDEIMLGALKAYSRANQAVIITPFIMLGAMSPSIGAHNQQHSLARVRMC